MLSWLGRVSKAQIPLSTSYLRFRRTQLSCLYVHLDAAGGEGKSCAQRLFHNAPRCPILRSHKRRVEVGESGVAVALQERVSDILIALSDAASGDFTVRIETELSEDDPVGALARAINEMIGSLEEVERRRAGVRRELEQQLATIEAQAGAIRELSTPIIEVASGVLCLPVIGIMDTARAVEASDRLLAAVAERRARLVIVDITGVEVMDTQTTAYLIRLAKAVELLGANCALSGMGPEIAQTMVHAGVELEGISAFASLRDALNEAV
jgi:rsbT co-antagonist protein RsbR